MRGRGDCGPGSGATSFGAAFGGAVRSMGMGSSREGAMLGSMDWQLSARELDWETGQGRKFSGSRECCGSPGPCINFVASLGIINFAVDW